MSVRKRQKVQSECELSRSSTLPAPENPRNFILDTLPPEVLEMILQFLSLQEISSTVRLVNRRCYTVATSVLNSAFVMSGTKLETLIKDIESMKKSTALPMNRFLYARTINALKLMQSQYDLLRAVTWRYTHPVKEQEILRHSIYAGSLLDKLKNLLYQAATCPLSFMVQDCQSFLMACKRFMSFFEKISERRINRSPLVSGCKIIDLLDCLREGRQVLCVKVSKLGNVTMRIRYTMKRSWFICLQVPKVDTEDSWRDQQRFMYLRLRRLVGSVNEHLLEDSYYEEEAFHKKSLLFTPKAPPALTYSGYGECDGQFFYYGNMNKYAYQSKIQLAHEGSMTSDMAETHEEMRNESSYDLIVTVELKCSWDLAPLAVRGYLKTNELDCPVRRTRHRELLLKLIFDCPIADRNRLPRTFTWGLSTRRRRRS